MTELIPPRNKRERRSEIIEVRVTPRFRKAIERIADEEQTSVSEIGNAAFMGRMSKRIQHKLLADLARAAVEEETDDYG